MLISCSWKGKSYSVDTGKPIDLSIPLRSGDNNVNAFFIPPVKIEPFRFGTFTGSVLEGGSCNVNNILFNPHGNGTHTECVGHISKEPFTINESLKTFFFFARIITITPLKQDDEYVITKEQVEKLAGNDEPEALIIRTLPNAADKLTKKYSGTNPPYLLPEAARWMCDKGVKHLLLDLPSVDREDDDGNLFAHHEFWNYPKATRNDATITELIYVPDQVADGDYLLNLLVASFENDASPSKPVVYQLIPG